MGARKCIFCEQPFADASSENDSFPLIDKTCCNLCNFRIVVPVKLAQNRNETPRVRLISMENEPLMGKGLEGDYDFVDSIGQIHVKWDNGSTLALVPKVDIFTIY